MNEETFWDRVVAEDPVGRLTTAELRDALAGFPIEPDSFDQLLHDLQIAVVSSRGTAILPYQVARKNITSAREALRRARTRLDALGNKMDLLWPNAGTYWLGIAAKERARDVGARSPGRGIAPAVVFPEFDRFVHFTNELEWAEEFLSVASALVPKQKARWRQREMRDNFVRLAREVRPIYEALTGRRATLNRWPLRRSPGLWLDFYLRIAKLALSVSHVPDVEGVLLEANKPRSRHSARRNYSK